MMLMINTRKVLPVVGAYVATVCLLILGIFAGSRAVTVISEGLPIEDRRCIVIDPGHGGEDGGAVSCTGKPESAYNLEISLRLRDLMHLLGYDTEMTRTTDISVYTSGETLSQKKISDLKERLRFIHAQEDPLLLSIHQNQFTDSRYSGAQVFYAGTEGSDLLARQLQESFTASLNIGSSRKSKKSQGVYLMEQLRCTGVLIECGFLSNPEEEAKLSSPEYQKKLCCVIAAAVAEYLS